MTRSLRRRAPAAPHPRTSERAAGIGGRQVEPGLGHAFDNVGVHAVGGCSRRQLQRFTAEQGEEGRVFILPEKGDTDADLNRVLCPGIANRKIGGRTKIDVTDCLPKGVAKALGLGPYNCAQFVNLALQENASKASTKDIDSALTVKLWHELLKKGHRIVNLATVDKDGKVERVKEITWKQLDPRVGDIVFMAGDILPNNPKSFKEPDPAGDTFEVTWDHVAFFIVRSRKGIDFHLAKDGDENPIGVYHTGTTLKESEGSAPGAYVRGRSTIVAYLRAPEKKAEAEPTPTKTPPPKPAPKEEAKPK